MVDLLFVWVRLCVGFAYTFGNNACIAFCVTSILAILALHASRIFEKVPAQRTTHNIVELLRHELVTVHLVHFLFTLSNGTFSVETNIEWPAVLGLLGETYCQMDRTGRFEGKPCIDWLGGNDTSPSHLIVCWLLGW